MLTYLDSGVIIAFAQSQDSAFEAARNLLADRKRRFVTSDMAWLETYPGTREALVRAAYDWYFAGATRIALDASLIGKACELARRSGVKGADAIHAAAALRAGAAEFVTTEKSSKPLFRVEGMRVVRLA